MLIYGTKTREGEHEVDYFDTSFLEYITLPKSIINTPMTKDGYDITYKLKSLENTDFELTAIFDAFGISETRIIKGHELVDSSSDYFEKNRFLNLEKTDLMIETMKYLSNDILNRKECEKIIWYETLYKGKFILISDDTIAGVFEGMEITAPSVVVMAERTGRSLIELKDNKVSSKIDKIYGVLDNMKIIIEMSTNSINIKIIDEIEDEKVKKVLNEYQTIDTFNTQEEWESHISYILSANSEECENDIFSSFDFDDLF